MSYCMAAAESERRCLEASERWDGGGEASVHSVTSSRRSVFRGVIKRCEAWEAGGYERRPQRPELPPVCRCRDRGT